MNGRNIAAGIWGRAAWGYYTPGGGAWSVERETGDGRRGTGNSSIMAGLDGFIQAERVSLWGEGGTPGKKVTVT